MRSKTFAIFFSPFVVRTSIQQILLPWRGGKKARSSLITINHNGLNLSPFPHLSNPENEKRWWIYKQPSFSFRLNGCIINERKLNCHRTGSHIQSSCIIIPLLILRNSEYNNRTVETGFIGVELSLPETQLYISRFSSL